MSKGHKAPADTFLFPIMLVLVKYLFVALFFTVAMICDSPQHHNNDPCCAEGHHPSFVQNSFQYDISWHKFTDLTKSFLNITCATRTSVWDGTRFNEALMMYEAMLNSLSMAYYGISVSYPIAPSSPVGKSESLCDRLVCRGTVIPKHMLHQTVFNQLSLPRLNAFHQSAANTISKIAGALIEKCRLVDLLDFWGQASLVVWNQFKIEVQQYTSTRQQNEHQGSSSYRDPLVASLPDSCTWLLRSRVG
ncbi:hypothetical protein B0H10DRAFT_1945906 [Mycena sp. CBHHK59/15]|nr:hypothetical protein B0H10DRAFT_1945906 [Mycena sp. CBHHK59/15]